MRRIVKSSFLWQFAIGFVIGTLGLVSVEPRGATQTLENHFLSSARQVP